MKPRLTGVDGALKLSMLGGADGSENNPSQLDPQVCNSRDHRAKARFLMRLAGGADDAETRRCIMAQASVHLAMAGPQI
jgi:hypothetical protein